MTAKKSGSTFKKRAIVRQKDRNAKVGRAHEEALILSRHDYRSTRRRGHSGSVGATSWFQKET